MTDWNQDCNTCKYDLLKSCRYPCSECHWLYRDKWEAKEDDDGE